MTKANLLIQLCLLQLDDLICWRHLAFERGELEPSLLGVRARAHAHVHAYLIIRHCED